MCEEKYSYASHIRRFILINLQKTAEAWKGLFLVIIRLIHQLCVYNNRIRNKFEKKIRKIYTWNMSHHHYAYIQRGSAFKIYVGIYG